MAEILSLSITVQGQSNFSWPSFCVGATVNLNLVCIDPSAGGPLNLAGVAVIWTMVDRFTGTVRVSRQASITNAGQGLCTVSIASGDTVPSGPLPSGLYNVDCWAEDASGNRLDLAYGTMVLGPAYRLPNSPVFPLPAQTPIAGYATVQNASGTAVTQRNVVEFTGSGVSSVVDDSVNARTVVTIVAGGGAVSSVSNSDSTLTVSPTTGAVVASLNLGHANTWTAAQTFQNGTLQVDNSANTFATTLASAATAARTWTYPDATDTAVGLAVTQTLTNKTLSSPTLSGTASASAQFIFSNSLASSTTPPWVITTSGDYSASSNPVLEIQTNATRRVCNFAPQSLGGYIQFYNSSSAFVQSLFFNGSYIQQNGGNYLPGGNASGTVGQNGTRWNAIMAYWADTKVGAQLTAAATITPTSGTHHVTGATTITTIATGNLPSSGTVELTLIADGGTITLNTGGNIAVNTTIAVNTHRRFFYDGTNWYPHN